MDNSHTCLVDSLQVGGRIPYELTSLTNLEFEALPLKMMASSDFISMIRFFVHPLMEQKPTNTCVLQLECISKLYKPLKKHVADELMYVML